ncbi:MAG: FAD-dependent monooxygenase, partial [Longimicrobiales bacterium]
MKILIVGGGPSGLYFGILMKRADSTNEVVVLERNRPDETFGFGVVFSDKTIAEVESADPETYRAITDHFVHWDDIDVHYGGEMVRSSGHGFSGLSRQTLLTVLQDQATALGIEIHFECEFAGLESGGSVSAARADGTVSTVSVDPADYDLVLGSDGVNSTLRETWAEHFQPTFDYRPNRFVWLGTTKPFPAFTFYFRENEHGLWRVHAYQYEPGRSTFIVECTEEAWLAAKLDQASEEETLAYCADVFADELDGHELIPNRSVWRSFPTIRCANWHHGNVVLLGDAVHTAHFSIGSGTRLGMLDGIALHDALVSSESISGALESYARDRRPPVESLQRAAQASLEWFEATER